MHCREASAPITTGHRNVRAIRAQIDRQPDARSGRASVTADESPDDAPPAEHPDPGGRARRAGRRRPPPDVRLRPDGLPLRPRRQPPDVPPRRPDPARRPVPRDRRSCAVQNITDVGHLRDERFDRGRGPDARRGRARAQDRGRDRRRVRGRVPRRRGAPEPPARPTSSRGPPSTSPRWSSWPSASSTRATPTSATQGNVYYAVASFPAYGALSGNTLDALRAGHRGEVERDKRDPADFALWKAAGEGRMLKWPTPRWGEGFPGWHLECSAMALRHLGPRFDVHTGGIDNVFPHHEDEIAQSAPIVGGPPARIWVHGEFLQVGGRKMAKSAGNIERIADVAARGHRSARVPLPVPDLALPPQARVHGRARSPARPPGSPRCGPGWPRSGPRPADGPWAAPAPLRAGAAAARPDRAPPTGSPATATARRARADATAPTRRPLPCPPAGRALHERFVAALDDDLDLPTALAVVRETLRADLPADERRWLILDADFVLGLDLDRASTAGRTAGSPISRPTSRRSLERASRGPRRPRLRDGPTRLRDRARASSATSDRRAGRARRVAELARLRSAGREVPPPAEAVDDPVEVALAQAVALGLGERGPAAVLVPGRRDRDRDRAPRRALLALVAEDEAPPDVEVAVEAEALVERAARGRVGAAERDRVALDRGDVAGPARPRTCGGRR